MHEEQSDYECDSCGKLFNDNENLKIHIQSIHFIQSMDIGEFPNFDDKSNVATQENTNYLSDEDSILKHQCMQNNVILKLKRNDEAEKMAKNLKESLIVSKSSIVRIMNVCEINEKDVIGVVRTSGGENPTYHELEIPFEAQMENPTNNEIPNSMENLLQIQQETPKENLKEKCDFSGCGKSFSQAEDLRKHIINIHKEKPMDTTMQDATMQDATTQDVTTQDATSQDTTSQDTTQNPMENTRIIKEEVMIVEEIITTSKPKTVVEITVEGIIGFHWIEIPKPPSSITLNDVKIILMRQPKMYGMSSDMNYHYKAKVKKGDKVGFLTITDDQTILPLYGDQIELECWPDLKL